MLPQACSGDRYGAKLREYYSNLLSVKYEFKKNQNRIQHISSKILKKLIWISKLGIQTVFLGKRKSSFEEENSAHKNSKGAVAPGNPH